jgi:hypothetical protein
MRVILEKAKNLKRGGSPEGRFQPSLGNQVWRGQRSEDQPIATYFDASRVGEVER